MYRPASSIIVNLAPGSVPGFPDGTCTEGAGFCGGDEFSLMVDIFVVLR